MDQRNLDNSNNMSRNIYSNTSLEFSVILKTFKRSWKSIILITLIFGLIGIMFVSLKNTNYIAKVTFVVEESKNSTGALGGLSSLAGQLGVDIGGSVGGVFSGDNIILYFKSFSLVKKVFLSKFGEKNRLFAEYYFAEYGLKEKWERDKRLKKLDFSVLAEKSNTSKSNSKEDSLLNRVIEGFIANQLKIDRVDKKSSFFEVSVLMKDPSLAKFFAEKIVETAVDQYIGLKTSRQQRNVEKLQKRLDSISSLLNTRINLNAEQQTANIISDINPLYKTLGNINFEKTARDKTILTALYSTVIQNLEVAKFSLNQETPIIQIIDRPQIPLKNDQMSKFRFGLIFSLLGFISYFSILLIRVFIINNKEK